VTALTARGHAPPAPWRGEEWAGGGGERERERARERETEREIDNRLRALVPDLNELLAEGVEFADAIPDQRGQHQQPHHLREGFGFRV